MGYQIETVSTEVQVRLSRHNSERDERHNALAEELQSHLAVMTAMLLSSGKYDEILLNVPELRLSNSLAISDDVTMTVDCDAGKILHLPLRMAAIVARVNDGEILPFVYDRHVSDDDEEHAPEIRKARLMIVDDGPIIV